MTDNRQILGEVLCALKKNEIRAKARKAGRNTNPYRSKLGGMPAVPSGFEWPRFEAENYDGETANRPLSFLCQIDLNEITMFDKDGMLPNKGLLLFFYEQDSMCWGFDPADDGCCRVYYFEEISELKPLELPEDLKEEYWVKEFDLAFSARDSYPSYEELRLHSDIGCEWDEYDEALGDLGYEIEAERHKLLGYANLIQGEMLTECERTARGLYCGDAESYRSTPEDVKADIHRKASDWVLLFQLASIYTKDYELMFGDLGNLYFYIRKQDLADRRFDRARFSLQCG